jgi:O-antigen ligase
VVDTWAREEGASGIDAVTWLTLYLVVLFAIPSRLVIAPLGSAGALSMLMGLGSLGIWGLVRVGVWQPLDMELRPIRMALAVFLFSVGVSYAVAMSRPISRDEVSPADVALLCLLSWSGTLLIAHDGIANLSRLDALIWRTAVCGGLMAALGLAQFVSGQSYADRISIPGLTAIAGTGIGFRNGLVRPAGTATSPIEYGTLLSIILPLALHVAFDRRRNALVRWLPAMAIGAVIAVSSSRSAYLGAAIAGTICLLGWPGPRRRVLLALGVVGVAAAGTFAPRLFTSITGMFTGASEDPSVESRTGSYSVAWEFLSHHPWFGRGLGTFLPKYRIFDNEYLGLLVCVGVVGTLAFLALALVCIVELTRTARSSADAEHRALAVALVAAIVAGFASLAFFDAFAFPMTMGTVFLVLGLAGATVRLVAEPPLMRLARARGRGRRHGRVGPQDRARPPARPRTAQTVRTARTAQTTQTART